VRTGFGDVFPPLDLIVTPTERSKLRSKLEGVQSWRRGIYSQKPAERAGFDDFRQHSASGVHSAPLPSWQGIASRNRAACYRMPQQMIRNDRERPPPPTKTTEPRPAWMRDPALLPRKPPRMPVVPDRRRRDDPGA
jgi:hypothetical protein